MRLTSLINLTYYPNLARNPFFKSGDAPVCVCVCMGVCDIFMLTMASLDDSQYLAIIH